jgi:hypothetical protein
MPALHRSLALVLSVTSSAAGAVQEAREPMAPFARLVGGEWRMTRDDTAIQFDTWTWGPGRRSVVNSTHGTVDDAPWRVLDVYYWHPGLEEVRVLGLHPDIPKVGRGVMEGAIAFEDESAEARFDLFQPGSAHKPRTMCLRWVFAGSERYRETLLEADGPDAAFSELAGWDYVRGATLTPAPPLDAPLLEPSEDLRALAPLLGGTWTPRGDAAWTATLEWLPVVEVVRVRVRSAADGDLRLEAYLYHHPTQDVLRCLALTADGGVYEGRLPAPEGGSLRLPLAGRTEAGANRHDVLLEPQPDGAWRARAWSLEAAGRTPVLDALLARGEAR